MIKLEASDTILKETGRPLTRSILFAAKPAPERNGGRGMAMIMLCALSIYTAAPCAMPAFRADDEELVRDICAITAIEDAPAGSGTADKQAVHRAMTLAAEVSWPPFETDSWSIEARENWGRCLETKGIGSIAFSPDRRMAHSYGGTEEEGGRGPRYEECVYEKLGANWRTVGCFTAVAG